MTLINSGPYACGETPLWDSRNKKLYWVDAATHLIHCRNKNTGKTNSYDTSLPVTAIRMNREGQFMLLSKWGLHIWNPDTDGSRGTILQSREFLSPHDSLRFNDGVPMDSGDFIAGAFDESDLYNGRGFLYRMNMEGKFEILDSNLHVPNGVALSPDNSTIYMSEMYKYRINSYSYGSDGSITKKIFIKLPEDQGKPDGLLSDNSGNLWIAHWQGHCLTCHDESGNNIRTVSTPCTTPTCPCFTDADESGLYVTSATMELTDDDMMRYEHQGGVFRIDL